MVLELGQDSGGKEKEREGKEEGEYDYEREEAITY